MASIPESRSNTITVGTSCPPRCRTCINTLSARNSLEDRAEQQGKSVRIPLRFQQGMSEADFAVFEDSAIRFGDKEETFNKQLAAIRQADRAQHPD